MQRCKKQRIYDSLCFFRMMEEEMSRELREKFDTLKNRLEEIRGHL